MPDDTVISVGDQFEQVTNEQVFDGTVVDIQITADGHVIVTSIVKERD